LHGQKRRRLNLGISLCVRVIVRISFFDEIGAGLRAVSNSGVYRLAAIGGVERART
jgi:hypothetical protein